MLLWLRAMVAGGAEFSFLGASRADRHTPPRATSAPGAIFALVVFTSAALVFTVEPMVARMVLPWLGGSAAVWNTCLVFFQAALLVGYLYAAGLQWLRSLRTQILVHGLVLASAALSLPLALSTRLGDVAQGAPSLWLIGVLTLSVGGPFAALSATAPLAQAWSARALPDPAGRGPWGLYGASNLGSLLALVAYPTLIEPALGLSRQTIGWSTIYGAFVALFVALSVGLWRQDSPARPVAPRSEIQWIDRVRWVGLAAIPSSLLLGVTSYVTTDIGSAPFLWIGPLVLYLLTFVLAFRTPAFWPRTILAIQAFTAIAACALSRPMPLAFLFGGAVHFANFFFTALVAHQALMARRPAPGRLTEFYVWLSVGGVLGGAFNAFVAPVAFDTLVEYPAVLVLSCLVRPWNSARPAKAWPVALFLLCGLTMAAAAWLAHPAPARLAERVSALGAGKQAFIGILVMAAAAMAFGLRNRSPLFALAALVVVVGAGRVAAPADVVSHWRGFYGVLRESRVWEPGLGGEVRKLAHGSTLHGVEAVSPAYRCQPLLYYAHETPIGQVFDAEARIKPSLNVGAVGLGAGTVAAYERPEDHFTFFEIDPLVVKIAKDSGRFSYLNGCAKGRVDQVIGDARWSLARQADKRFDILLIDAFSSDSVPAHLLTVEAVHLYLSKIKPDGVVILHLSNRNLDLMNPAQAVARINGAFALTQRHIANPQLPPFWESSEDAVVLAPTPQGLAPFVADPRWQAPDDHNVAPWTDDHTDIFGALLRRLGTTRRE